jgi:hypothetical protein
LWLYEPQAALTLKSSREVNPSESLSVWHRERSKRERQVRLEMTLWASVRIKGVQIHIKLML